jgi:hypothetical protein
MQRALNIVQYRAEELSISPDDRDFVFFTKRKKVDGFIEPVLLNRMICPLGW